jgi:hypothetical protein
MPKSKHPTEQSEAKRRKLKSPNTRGKNAAGQTNGQFERDSRRRQGQFSAAGEPPLMHK